MPRFPLRASSRPFPSFFPVLFLAVLPAAVLAGARPAAAATGIWTPLGPEGGEVTALAVSPRTVWAGLTEGQTASGVYRSLDDGATWERRDAGLPPDVILALALDPTAPTDPATLWLSLSSGGVYRSTDSGATWTLLPQPVGTQAVDLAVAPPTESSPAVLYLARQSYAGLPSAVLRSTDRGDTWTPLRAGLGIRLPQALGIDPSNPGHLLLGTVNGSLWTWTVAP